MSVVTKTSPSQDDFPAELIARTRNPYRVPGCNPVTVLWRSIHRVYRRLLTDRPVAQIVLGYPAAAMVGRGIPFGKNGCLSQRKNREVAGRTGETLARPVPARLRSSRRRPRLTRSRRTRARLRHGEYSVRSSEIPPSTVRISVHSIKVKSASRRERLVFQNGFIRFL